MHKLIGQDLYKSFNKRETVKGISIDINSREIIGLFGPNGAGKTTSFLMIAGIIFPDRGKIFIDEQDATLWPLYKKARFGIGYLPQDNSIFKNMSVEDNLYCILELIEKTKADINDRLEKLLSEFNINHIRKRNAHLLSGGERRRVEIARALASKPKFLLLDEPFAGIDPKSIEEIKYIIKNISFNGVGILITEHNVRETLDLIDRAYIMYDGSILYTGTGKEIKTNKNVKDLYLGNLFE